VAVGVSLVGVARCGRAKDAPSDAAGPPEPRGAHDVPVAAQPQLSPFLHRAGDLEHGNWLTTVALTLLCSTSHTAAWPWAWSPLPVRPHPAAVAWAGAIADRSNKRKLLLVTQSLEMAESIGLAVLPPAHPPLAACTALAIVGAPAVVRQTPAAFRSSPRWCRPRTSPTRSCSTASSSTSRASSDRRWPACWWSPWATAGVSRSTPRRTGRHRLYRPHAPRRAPPPSARAAGQGRGARRAALRGFGAVLWVPFAMFAGSAPRLQLQRHPAAAGHDAFHRTPRASRCSTRLQLRRPGLRADRRQPRTIIALRHIYRGAVAAVWPMLALAAVPGICRPSPSSFS